MPDYSVLSDQIKNQIIDDYLKKNPDVQRHEVTTKIVNGRIIAETITNLMANSAKKKPSPSPGYKKLLDKLKQGADERYAETLDSVGTCRNYSEWLSDNPFTGFGEKDKNNTNDFLDRREEMIGKRSVELLYVRKKFADMMKSKVKPQPSLVKTLSMEYLAATIAQLKLQGAIFNKEVDLGGIFSSSVQKFIAENINNFGGASEKVLVSVGKAFRFLKNETVQEVMIPNKDVDQEKVKEQLDNLGIHLNRRRDQYKMIQQLIDFLSQMLDNLAKVDPDAPAEAESDQQSFRRMARTTGRSRSGGRR